MTDRDRVSPVLLLLRSRKFLLLCMDTVVSLILWGVGLWIPDILEQVQYVIGVIQPVFVALIGAIALEDAAQKHNS